MKKTLLATALTAAVAAPSVSAIELYNDGKDTMSVGGWLDARVVNHGGDTEVVNGASRINFAFNRDMGNGWNSFMKFEWGVNPVGESKLIYNADSKFQAQSGKGQFMHNRLGYVGIGNEDLGSISIGKQWSVWYDVVGNTNIHHVWDGNTSGTYTFHSDGGVNGTGRADNAIQYRNSFGDFDIALQGQFKKQEVELKNITSTDGSVNKVRFNGTVGFSSKYQVNDDLKILVGANTGKFEGVIKGQAVEETDYIYGASFTYGGNWDEQGSYLSVNVNQQQNHDVDNAGYLIRDAWGLESLAGYTFQNNIRLMASYNILDGQSDVAGINHNFKRQFMTAGIHYIWGKTTMYFEVRKDLSEFSGADQNWVELMKQGERDGLGFGVRYYI
ncbi:porin [Paraferrimonas sp. SM1919]|uniref:porin n=1 Tax=Paraferrimonas sp. SM1919 TaxID=2662263 RepID=UPI0013D0FB49|nr:porin [Paraferrimonas sp. SM1919]